MNYKQNNFSQLSRQRNLRGYYLFFRLALKVKGRHPIKVGKDALENTNVQNANVSGCQETPGQIWDKNALNATLMYTHTNR